MLRALRLLAIAASFATAAFSAQAVAILSYDLIRPYASGPDGFTYTYENGSGTLNDGVIPNSKENNQLFLQLTAPEIVLHLGAITAVDSISFFGGVFANNFYSGRIVGVDITINGITENLRATGFGDGCLSTYCNNQISTLGTSLQNLATDTVLISHITGGIFEPLFSGGTMVYNIGEIRVDGPSPANDVPEPASLVLVGLGLALLAATRQTRQ